MATLYSNAQGVIIRFLHSPALETQFPNAPAGAAFTLQFDEETNEALTSGLRADIAGATYDGVNLRRVSNGQIIPIATPSLRYQARQALAAMRTRSESGQALTATQQNQLNYLSIRYLQAYLNGQLDS